ncbi:hypothetical protein N883_0254 [Listeria monocytogenes serotype 1/2a str. 01-5252]|nr:hypothetical protein N883_0254 [Listeria monocytogenes serotype 1/2a str. 01-5252]ASH83342.1 hypothetical protein N882_0255 [Listeria monocytogenes serotype 1/2a str. 01-1468]
MKIQNINKNKDKRRCLSKWHVLQVWTFHVKNVLLFP